MVDESGNRLSRESIHLATATLWAGRSLCRRAAVGCVLTDPTMRKILSVGYNGPARGLPHDTCTGEEGKCGCLHAEDNAVAAVDSTIPDKVAFITVTPCRMCAQRLIQANVTRVVRVGDYRLTMGEDILKAVGIKLERVHSSQVNRALSAAMTTLRGVM